MKRLPCVMREKHKFIREFVKTKFFLRDFVIWPIFNPIFAILRENPKFPLITWMRESEKKSAWLRDWVPPWWGLCNYTTTITTISNYMTIIITWRTNFPTRLPVTSDQRQKGNEFCFAEEKEKSHRWKSTWQYFRLANIILAILELVFVMLRDTTMKMWQNLWSLWDHEFLDIHISLSKSLMKKTSKSQIVFLSVTPTLDASKENWLYLDYENGLGLITFNYISYLKIRSNNEDPHLKQPTGLPSSQRPTSYL